MAQLAADKEIVDAAKQMKADLEKKHAENRMTLLEMSILMVRFPFLLHRGFLLFTLAGRVLRRRVVSIPNVPHNKKCRSSLPSVLRNSNFLKPSKYTKIHYPIS
jgi:hypothetical protein